MADRPALIVRVLGEAYGSLAGDYRPALGQSLVAEVTRIIRIYAESMKVRPVEVISTDTCGIVLTQETATIDGTSRTWNGVHRWCFGSGRSTRFEVSGQTLVVAPPRI